MSGWRPYLVVFAANVLWRLLVFNNQIYQPTLAVRALECWDGPGRCGVDRRPTTVQNGSDRVEPDSALPKHYARWPSHRCLLRCRGCFGWHWSWARSILLARRKGAAASRGQSLAGRPGPGCHDRCRRSVLLTGLEVTIAYPANRFTLPFMLGVSLLLAGLLMYLPWRLRLGVALGLMCLAAGRQALWAEDFRHDWATQKTLFWQMVWRAPGIAPNTIVLLNEGALPYYADNSLTGALNWIYDPDNRSTAMDYVLFYPTSRLGNAAEPEGRHANPLRFHLGGLLRQHLADPGLLLPASGMPAPAGSALDPENHLDSRRRMMREAARPLLQCLDPALTGTRGCRPSTGPNRPTAGATTLNGPNLQRRCGLGAVADLGDEAFRLDDHPNDPVERFVFVEGYARTGDWSRALELSGTSYRVSRAFVGPLLCRLWSRIEHGDDRRPGQKARRLRSQEHARLHQ